MSTFGRRALMASTSLKRSLRFCLAAVSIALAPATVLAQSTIAGAVRDASGAVLPGVTVEASSPELIEKSRTVVTNGEGRYSIVDIRPGVYTVTFALQGFNTVRLEEIIVPADVSVPVNAEMKVGTIEETITVAAASPVVDVQNISRTQVMTREMMDNIPNEIGRAHV